MRRPSLQFYPGDWQANPKLKRCSHTEKGLWLDVLCILHDQDEYGIVRWPLRDIAAAVHARPSALQSIVDKDILKGADPGQTCAPLIYVPRSGRRDGEPVTLIPAQEGPIWYSSRMVRDEHVRKVRADNQPTPKPAPKVSIGEGIGETLRFHPSRAGAGAPHSSSSSSSSSSSVVVDDTASPNYPFDFFAVVEYEQVLKPEPGLAIQQAEVIAIAVDDTPLSRAVWTEVLDIFKGNGHQRRYAGNVVDRYKNEMAKIADKKREPPAGLAREVSRTPTLKERLNIH